MCFYLVRARACFLGRTSSKRPHQQQKIFSSFPKKANERQQCYVWRKFLTSLYPFNPVPANPAMNLLWRNANKRATGKAPSIALAIISSQAALHFPISIPSLTVTGITLSWFRKVKGNRKLFQLHMATMTTVVITPGRATGKTMRQNACNMEAPSINAASSNSFGIFIK